MITNELPESEPAVIIIDDDPNFVDDFVSVIRDERHLPFLTAHSSTGAIQKLRSILKDKASLPRVIFLDLHMEDDFSGYRVLKFLRTFMRDSSIPIVVVSHSSHTPDIERAYKMGATSYVQKPMDILKLRPLLAKLADYWCTTNKTGNSEAFTHSTNYKRAIVRNAAGVFEFAKLPNLYSYRALCQLTQNKLARLSGVPVEMIGAAEHGEPIRIGDLYKIIRVIGARLTHKIDLEGEIVRISQQ